MPLVSKRERVVGESVELGTRRLSEDPRHPAAFSDLKAVIATAPDEDADRFLTDVTLCTSTAAALVSLADPLVWSGRAGVVGTGS